MAGSDGPERGDGAMRLEWNQALGETLRSLEGIARLVQQRYPHPEVDEVASRVLRQYSPRERLRRKNLMSVEEQVRTAEIFFAIDLFSELAGVAPELISRVADLETLLRRDPEIVAAWQELSPGFVIDGCAPALDVSSAPGDQDSFKSWRSPSAAIARASHGRGLDTLPRIPADLHQIPEHHDDASWLEAAFLRFVEREMRRALHPFGLEGRESRDAVVLGVQLIHHSEWPYGFGEVIHDQDGGSSAKELLWSALRNMSEDADRPEKKSGRPSTFDLIRLGFAVQRRVLTKHPEPTSGSADGWLTSLRREIFPRDTSLNASAWGSTLRRLFPYDAVTAVKIERLAPAGTYRIMQEAAPDFKAHAGDQSRFEFVIKQARSMVLESFWRERLENEQAGNGLGVWNVYGVNGRLRKQLRWALLDCYTEANQRPVEQISDFDIDDNDDNFRRYSHFADSFRLDYADDGTPLRGRQGPDYPRDDSDHGQKRTAVPWVDEFLLFAPQIVEWWKISRRMEGRNSDERFTAGEVSTLKMLTSFVGWLAGEVRSREQDPVDRKIRHANVGVEIVPLETQLRDESARFDGGLTEALLRWTATVPHLKSQAARTKVRQDIKKLFRAIYLEINQRWGTHEPLRPDSKIVEIFDSIPVTVRDHVWKRLTEPPRLSDDSA